MIFRFWWVLGLMSLVGIAHGDPGDMVVAVKDYTFGPLMYLVIALGMLACLYQFARGDKSAALFILAGVIFIASMRTLIPQWFGAANPGTTTSLSFGEFPYYGQTSSVQVPGEVQAYDDMKSWGYIGLMSCHSLINLIFSLGIPVIIATIGALLTFHRLAVMKQAGSVIGYLLLCIFVGTFCLFPLVSFSPVNPTQVQSSDVVMSFGAANAGSPSTALTNPDLLSIPLLPALLLSGGVDLTESIGVVLNTSPASSFPAHILTAARHAALPAEWFSTYAEYSAQCAAAQQGFVAGEPANATAMFSQARWKEGISQSVASSSLNLLSAWGDALLALVPLHGYVINDEQALAVEGSRDEVRMNAIANTWKWVPTDLSEHNEISSMLDRSHINTGLPTNAKSFTADYKTVRALQTPANMPVWTLPKGLPAPDFAQTPSSSWVIPYCSVPDPLSASAFAVEVNRANGANNAVSDWATDPSGVVTTQSGYLTEMVQAVAMPGSSDQDYTVSLLPYDWGEELRNDLLLQFDASLCLSACGNPAHKFFWGCMVTGAFVQIANGTPNICDASADTTRAFYGQTVAGVNYTNYAQLAAGGYYLANQLKVRSLDDLTSSALSGNPILSASPGARRAAVDAIMGAPGTFSQNGLARDAYSFPTENDSQFSIWNFFQKIPQMAMWLLGLFATIAAMLISFLWPHFMGIVLLLFLLVYPVFACLALWPAKWVVLLEWARGLLWVLMWAPVATLGYSLINSGAYLTQEAAFLSATPGPGQTLLTLVGAALILMAPAIAQAIITPTFASLSGLGTAVYGTAFKVIGIAAQLAGALAGVAVGAVGAGVAAAAGAPGEPVKGAGPGGGSGGSGSPAAPDAGDDPDRFSHMASSAAAGGRLGLSAGRQASRFASQAMSVAESFGAEGLGVGAHTGEAVAMGIYSGAGSAGQILLSTAQRILPRGRSGGSDDVLSTIQGTSDHADLSIRARSEQFGHLAGIEIPGASGSAGSPAMANGPAIDPPGDVVPTSASAPITQT